MVFNTSTEAHVEKFRVLASDNGDIADLYRNTLDRLLLLDNHSLKDVFNFTRITLRLFNEDNDLWEQLTQIIERSIDDHLEHRGITNLVYLVRACFVYQIKFPDIGSPKILNFLDNFMMNDFINLTTLQKFEVFSTFFNQ